MNDMKIAILGHEDNVKNALIKNLTRNVSNVKFNGMKSGIDIGYTVKKGKRVYLFGAKAEERKRFFEEVLPAGIDLGIVVVDSNAGMSKKDKKVIEDLKEKKMPCMVFFNDDKENRLSKFGKSIVHGSAENSLSTEKLLEFLIEDRVRS